MLTRCCNSGYSHETIRDLIQHSAPWMVYFEEQPAANIMVPEGLQKMEEKLYPFHSSLSTEGERLMTYWSVLQSNGVLRKTHTPCRMQIESDAAMEK
jgi:hypothetical protein